MFKPNRFPKEGRSPPGLLHTNAGNGYQRSFRWRITAVIALVVIILYLVLFNGGDKATTLKTARPSNELIAEKTLTPDRSHQLTKNGDEESTEHVVVPVREPLEKIYKEPEVQPSIKQIKEEKADVESKARSSSRADKARAEKAKNISPAGPARESWDGRPELDAALAKIISMIPDEVHLRELTRPIDSTGKERMREMGLRTREYKKFFELWEAIHVNKDAQGNAYIRDDVVQYLRSRQQISTDSITEDGIDGFDIAQSVRSYEGIRAFITNFGKLLFPWTAPWFGDHMSLHTSIKRGGRGIVLTVGDDQAPYLLTTIYSFRKLGCTLPIEVMYLGDQDLGEDYRAELENLGGVITRDIAQMTNDQGWKLAGWAAKPFAILLSSFREVIFIDADSLFFVDPEVLFDVEEYKTHGALFFKDRIIMPESKKRFLQQVLPKPIPRLARQSRFWTGQSGHQMESGVVVIDKWKHFISLLLVSRFNGPDRDGNKEKGTIGVYDLMYGDKETFWLGFLLAGDEDFAFHPGDAAIMGELKSGTTETDGKNSESIKSDVQNSSTTDAAIKESAKPEGYASSTICAPQILHLDSQGKPLWFNGWLLHNKFADQTQKRFARFEHYLVEPREVREPTPWQLAESNMCCLTSDLDKTKEFSATEKQTIEMILARAGEMGMGNQS